MAEYEHLVEKLAELTRVEFRPASDYDLARLDAVGLPESVIEFYRSFEPERSVDAQVRLWPIEQIIEENADAVPGCITSNYGYVAFANTRFGDAYCFDVNPNAAPHAPIVLIPHDAIDDDTPPERIKRLAKPVARNLMEFLDRVLRGEIDEDPIYS